MKKNIFLIFIVILFQNSNANVLKPFPVIEWNRIKIVTPLASKAYVLSWSAADFQSWYTSNPRSNLMLQFLFDANKNLTLSGWATSSTDYDDFTPSVNDPSDGATSQFNIVTGDVADALDLSAQDYFYLGNLKITKGVLKTIKKFLNNHPHYNYILFQPLIDLIDHHIYYDVFISQNLPTTIAAVGGTKVAKTDPSPPAPHQ